MFISAEHTIRCGSCIVNSETLEWRCHDEPIDLAGAAIRSWAVHTCYAFAQHRKSAGMLYASNPALLHDTASHAARRMLRYQQQDQRPRDDFQCECCRGQCPVQRCFSRE